MNAILALEDGTWYRGVAAGASGETSGEVVFNTSMAQVPCITTLTGASAAVSAIGALRKQTLTVCSLQDYYGGVAAGAPLK